jgi:putative ABC transport system ATP-binding protein
MLQPFVEIKNIKLSFKSKAGSINVLNDVNLSVMQGEAIALVGPSGSGKSSLLMLIGGLEQPSSGQIFISNKEISDLDQGAMTAFRRKMIGVIFQSFHLMPTMTALENVMIPLEIMGAENISDRSHEALKKVGLSKRITHYPAELSGGEQQRVALARAIVTRPKLILADEPTGNLDKDSGDMVTKMLFDLKTESGSTMIIVTHSTNLAKKCDRQISISNGEIRQNKKKDNETII